MIKGIGRLVFLCTLIFLEVVLYLIIHLLYEFFLLSSIYQICNTFLSVVVKKKEFAKKREKNIMDT